MIKFSRNKLFILSLIIIISLSLFQIANAGDVVDTIGSFIDSVVNIVIDVSNITLNKIIGGLEIAIGYPLDRLGIDTSLYESGVCRFRHLNENVLTAGDGCEVSAVIYSPAINASCASQISLTFYNSVWQYNLNEDPKKVHFQLPDNSTTQVQFQLPDNSTRQVAVYRFTIPSATNNRELTNWFTSTIKNKIGSGVRGSFDMQRQIQQQPGYYTSNESQPLITINYSDMCDAGGKCQFVDNSVPKDSYIAYAMKILGPEYVYLDRRVFDSNWYKTGDNLFLSKNNYSYVNTEYRNNNSDNYVFAGPYKTGSCPLSANITGPALVEMPDPINLLWNSNNVSSCIASGSWNGVKSANGSETLLSETLGRGNHNFEITCTGEEGSVLASTTTKVIQVPKCSFSANPSSITLPQSSTLSWSCQYANTCSIDNNIGSVNRISGTKQVRPSTTTNYTLTCNGTDGERSWNAAVGVNTSGEGGGGRIEIVPR